MRYNHPNLSTATSSIHHSRNLRKVSELKKGHEKRKEKMNGRTAIFSSAERDVGKLVDKGRRRCL